MKKLIAFALAAGFSLAASAAPETYNIDPSHSFSRFEYSHFGYSTQVNKFNSTTGKIQIDRAAKTGSVEVTIDPKSVNTGSDLFNGHLQGPDFLDSAKYPAITYKSTKFLFNGDKVVGVTLWSPIGGGLAKRSRLPSRRRQRKDGRASWSTPCSSRRATPSP